MIGFWPYFLHEYSSGGMSAILELTAGTLIVCFARDFLFFEQWHLLPEGREYLPAASSEWLWPGHFREEKRGGFPADMGVEGAAEASWVKRREEPFFPLDTLLSPVMEDRNEEFADDMDAVILKLSLVNRLPILASPPPNPPGRGFEKSSVRDCGADDGGSAGGGTT